MKGLITFPSWVNTVYESPPPGTLYDGFGSQGKNNYVKINEGQKCFVYYIGTRVFKEVEIDAVKNNEKIIPHYFFTAKSFDDLIRAINLAQENLGKLKSFEMLEKNKLTTFNLPGFGNLKGKAEGILVKLPYHFLKIDLGNNVSLFVSGKFRK